MKASAVFSRSVLQKALSLLLFAAVLSSCLLMGGGAAAFADSEELSLADLYEQNVHSTVGITTSGKITSRYSGGYTYQTAGSGFIITDDGYILTNCHLVKGSDTVTVVTYDNGTYDAKVIGYDESSDVAVLKIEAEDLKPVKLGDSNTLRVGDPVCAIGNPLGELTFSLTHGIVSALSRNVRTSSGKSMSLIQTDCAINSGNSGGALFNSRGEVVGITNAKFSSNGLISESEIDNICFAVPISNVARIVTSIIENGYVVKPYIGITVSPLSEETASITGIKTGAVVQAVTEDAPADQAGMKVHDVIVKLDGAEIKDSSSLVQAVSLAEPGDVMTFTVYRQGEEIEIDVEVGTKTEDALKDEEETKDEAQDKADASQDLPQDWLQGIKGWSNNPFAEFFNFGN